MPPVPLPVPTPNLPFSNIANVIPHPPNDPPSVADVIAAKNYAQRALTAAQYPNHIDAQTTSDALVYAHSILAAASGGAAAPPWFAEALKLGLTPITTRLDDINGRLDGIDTRLDSIVTKIDQLTIFASQTPTALTNLAVLDNLSYEELRAYCEAYYPGRAYGNGQRLPERKKSIREAIGCTAEY
ncbi:hypothetical protein B0H17DRAFT_1187553 [Mycena rosella]|uniref:Mug135-like C-terminal domain-containing protein n=1 Tax=Mycena rosella TaxID=1033263 RepID=A0AAD7BZF9_MYCRO|nr:hypothetical protein B0H17DRAFT_1187553 [Mycena rosella]